MQCTKLNCGREMTVLARETHWSAQAKPKPRERYVCTCSPKDVLFVIDVQGEIAPVIAWSSERKFDQEKGTEEYSNFIKRMLAEQYAKLAFQ